MARDYLLTLDAGTGSARCVVFDVEGRPVAAAQEPFYVSLLLRSRPAAGARLRPRPGRLLGRARALRADGRRRAAGGRAHPRRERHRQREGCVFLDAAGEVLYAGPNLDARAVMQGMEVQSPHGARPPARHHGTRAALHLRRSRAALVPQASRRESHRDGLHAERLDHLPAVRARGWRSTRTRASRCSTTSPAPVVERDPGHASTSRRDPADAVSTPGARPVA